MQHSVFFKELFFFIGIAKQEPVTTASGDSKIYQS